MLESGMFSFAFLDCLKMGLVQLLRNEEADEDGMVTDTVSILSQAMHMGFEEPYKAYEGVYFPSFGGIAIAEMVDEFINYLANPDCKECPFWWSEAVAHEKAEKAELN